MKIVPDCHRYSCLQCVAKQEILSTGGFLSVWFLLQHSPAQLFPVIPC